MHGLNNIIDGDYIARIAKGEEGIKTRKKKWLCMNKLTAMRHQLRLRLQPESGVWVGSGSGSGHVQYVDSIAKWVMWLRAALCGLSASDCGLCARGWSFICYETADSAIVHLVASPLFLPAFFFFFAH